MLEWRRPEMRLGDLQEGTCIVGFARKIPHESFKPPGVIAATLLTLQQIARQA